MHIGLEWGEHGILAHPADVYILIDVLSFTTCVDIAASRGACILPFKYKDARAAAHADTHQALLAASRGQPGFSLSPASLQTLPADTRLVLPSPNGATLSLLTGETPTLAACLRNAAAVAEWIAAQGFRRVQIVPAGERWPDGSLRPALEDWLGAGAVLSHLQADLSPDARVAREAFIAQRGGLAGLIEACHSGQELMERGFGADVELAVQLNVSCSVPLLQSGAYAKPQ